MERGGRRQRGGGVRERGEETGRGGEGERWEREREGERGEETERERGGEREGRGGWREGERESPLSLCNHSPYG